MNPYPNPKSRTQKLERKNISYSVEEKDNMYEQDKQVKP
jgi:hypothetical protein